jgi:hypothetical protein
VPAWFFWIRLAVFILQKNKKNANNSITAENREKISADLEAK